MNRFYSTLGIDQAIKEQEEDNIETNNKINYMNLQGFKNKYGLSGLHSRPTGYMDYEDKTEEVFKDAQRLLEQQRKEILSQLRLKLRNTYKAEDIADTAFLTESDLEFVLKANN